MKNRIELRRESKVSVIMMFVIILLFNVIFYAKMPENLPVHWNIKNEVDNYSDKFSAFVIEPLVLALLNVLVVFFVDNDPRIKNQNNFMITFGKVIMPILLVLIYSVQVAYGLGLKIDTSLIAFVVVGVMCILIGNYFPKIKRNYTVGIKLPWTLHSDENWSRTHRFGGICFIAMGILFIISAFLRMEFLIYASIVILFLPVGYSFLLYKNGI